MNRDDLGRDRELGDAMRAFDGASVQPDVDALARRIKVAAKPLLDARRNAFWWEYAADWSRALIPIGVTAAIAASALIAWALRFGPTASPVDRGADARVSQQLLYALVGSVETNVTPRTRTGGGQ